jgi:hypothetical protein
VNGPENEICPREFFTGRARLFVDVALPPEVVEKYETVGVNAESISTAESGRSNT